VWFSGHLCFADQIGLTPEEVISKIMANPDVALAFQNPRVQQAIMEVYCNWLTINFMKSNHLCNILAILQCSQNPLSIAKYQNDKEV